MPDTELASAFAALHREMAEAWRTAPLPSEVRIEYGTPGGTASVDAVGVIFGWMARAIRTGQLAMLAASAGFSCEAAPLIRSITEHAIGLWWIVDQRGVAIHALVRSRSQGFRKFQAAQEHGWTLEGQEGQDLLREAIDLETDVETRVFDYLLHVKEQANKYGLGAEYQAWLIDTWESHATFTSAQPYYEWDRRNGLTLNTTPSSQRETEAAVVAMTHTALRAYNTFLPGEPLAEALNSWAARATELGEHLRSEHQTRRQPG